MNRILLALSLVCISVICKAQAPQISYNSPISLYVAKQASAVNVVNTGGAVISKLSPWVEPERSALNYYEARPFVKTASGDIYSCNTFQVIKTDIHGVETVLAGAGVSTGSLDGTGMSASFQDINGIALDKAGNIFVTENNLRDAANCKIRKITPQGVVTTYADGFNGLGKLIINNDGVIYVVESYGRILRVGTDGATSVFVDKNNVGEGSATFAASDLVIDVNGNIYLADSGNHLIRKVTPQGVVTVLAGSSYGNADGVGKKAQFGSFTGMAIDSHGTLWIFDQDAATIRKVTPDGTVVTEVHTTQLYDAQSKPIGFSFGVPFIIDKEDNLISTLTYGYFKVNVNGFSVDRDLPAGVEFGADGSISGTPTETSSLADYTVRAVNNDGVSITKFKLEVKIPQEAPVITKLSPDSASRGSSINIIGVNFSNATAVTIGGKPATSFYASSATQISAQVSMDAISGDVSVTTAYGKDSITGFKLIPPPTITSVSPLSGGKGAKIIIKGTNFNNISQVQIGGYYANYKRNSSTEIEATVGDYGASGDVSVSTGAGYAKFPGFVYVNAPYISLFTPNSAGAGATVTLTGTGFTNASSVKIGGVEATSFTVVSSTQIKAVVASGGTSGSNVTVTTPGGTGANYNYFTYLPPPSISSISPAKAGPGSTLFIYGSGFDNTTQVTIGGKAATVLYNASYSLSVIVPDNSTGDVKVTTASGSATATGFTFVSAPQITSFSPATAAMGDHITINGTNLDEVDQVTFGGIGAQFTINSSTSLDAIVGQGASGAVSIRSEGGIATLNGFTHKGPQVTSFLPSSAGNGGVVTITGFNFTGATAVTFGGVDAISFTVVSDTKISAVVGLGTSGQVAVATPLGGSSLSGFSHPGPSILSFSPAYAGSLSTTPITITGSNFTGATAVTFGGVPASSFVVVSPTTITAVVANAASGDVVVTTPQGTVKQAGFKWVSSPTITSFSPTSQKNGGSVTITGTGFYGVTSVKFGGVAALYYYASSPTSINATIGQGVSGDVSVATAGGNVSVSGFTYTSPIIQSISPTSAGAGQTVTISGSNFSDIQSVTFGGINAASFNIVSSGKITAVLGSGATGPVNISGASGSASITGFNYVSPIILSTITPIIGGTGTLITVTGSNFNDVTSVTIGGKAVEIVSKSSYSLVIKAGDNTSGTVEVKNAVSDVMIEGFQWLPAPTITSITPKASSAQDTVTITGTNFSNITSVKFGSQISGYRLVSSTIIKALNTGGVGDITVNCAGGTATYSGYTFLPAPTIASFTKTDEGSEATITISGSNFINVTDVQFGGIPAKSFTVSGTGKITAKPGVGASGLITVIASAGSASIAGYLYYTPPIIKSFSPYSGPVGTRITIEGDNFNPTAEKNIVYFGSIKAKVESATKTRLQVIAPAVADGLFTVTDLDTKLLCYSTLTFNITKPNPAIGLTNKLEIKLDNSPSTFLYDDFDNDGKLDMLVAKDDTLYILQNTSEGVLSRSSFKKRINLDTRRHAYSMTTGDIDGDGKKDILYSISNSVAVLKNTTTNGNISFSLQILEKIDRATSGMSLRDLDMDGKPDLCLIDDFKSLRVCLNKSNNSNIDFGPSVWIGAEYTGYQGITDITGDSSPDILLSGSFGSFQVSKNSNVTPGSIDNSGFTRFSFGKSWTYADWDIAYGDFDQDGKIDVLESQPGTTYLLASRNVSTLNTPAFGDQQLLSSSPAVGIGVVADINGDGKMDLVGGGSNTLYGYVNKSSDSNIQFNDAISLVKGSAQDFLTKPLVKDVDGDGTADLTFIDYYNKKITIYNNSPFPSPQIVNISPKTALKGAEIVITGKYFDETSVVKFGSKAALSFTVVSPDTIKAIVGEGETGLVTVQNPDGIGTYSMFTYGAPPVKIPVTNLKVSATNVTCKGQNNGSIDVVAVESHNYTATLTGTGTNKSEAFTSTLNFNSLAPGNYNVCVTSADLTDYKQCFDLVVTEPKDLAMYATVNKTSNAVTLALTGGNTYNVEVNGINYKTSSNQITIPLVKGVNRVVLSSDLVCQGKVEQMIDLNPNPIPYPNPVANVLYVDLGQTTAQKAVLQMYGVKDGALKLTADYPNAAGVLRLDVGQLPIGVYTLHVITDNKKTVYKIIKQ